MKEYRNFILVDDYKNIIAATYANCSSEPCYKKYTKTFPSTKVSNNNTDSLMIINKHIAQILKWKEENNSLSVYYLLIPPKLCKIIKDRIYKQWIDENSDKRFNVSIEEINQWKIFDALYKRAFTDLSFKPNNVYNSKQVNKSYKHVVFTKDVIDKMHVYLTKETREINTIEDLIRYN